MIEAAALCLALNIFFEARGEKFDGQEAVAVVTMERAGWKPDAVCYEVFRTRQFSWTNGHKLGITEAVDRMQLTGDAMGWRQAEFVASFVLGGKSRMRRKTHFHALKAKPKWAKSLKPVGRIGNHIFYVEEPSNGTNSRNTRSH